MRKNRLSSLCTAMLGLGLSLPAFSAQNIWIEAETAAESNPIVVKSDKNASGKIYLASYKWADYDSRSNDDGMIELEVYVPEAGEYTLWALSRLPWGGASPFDLSVDSGSSWSSWSPDNRPESELKAWGWSNSGYTKHYTKGTHLIKMVQREGGPGVQMDKFLLTPSLSYVPTGSGGEEGVLDIENPYKAKTVDKYGQLKLVGTQLSDSSGKPIQLQGISAHGLQWFPLVDKQTIPYTAEFFGSEAIRLAMYIEDFAPTDESDYWGGYVAEKEMMLARTEAAIQDAVNAGIYVLVDWHIHNDPSKYVNQASEFYEYISSKYGHLPNIIYEICNEPVSVSWSGVIKPYADKIIPIIRKNDPDNIVIVGTPNWSQDVDAAAEDPLNYSNVMYAFHYYAGTHDLNTMTSKVNKALDAGLGIFVSEWGSSDVGTSNSNLSRATEWMAFMNQKKLSWVNWSLGNKDESSSILKSNAPMSGPWVDSDLTAAGAWLKPYFDAPSGSYPNGSSSNSSNSSATAAIPAIPTTPATPAIPATPATPATPIRVVQSSTGELKSAQISSEVQIDVRMMGYVGTESVTLSVGGNNLRTWTLSTSMQTYTVSTSLSGQIRVAYTNDDGGNRDVRVDYINVGGETRQAENQNDNTGVFGNGSCGGGSYSEVMHCSGSIGFGDMPISLASNTSSRSSSLSSSSASSRSISSSSSSSSVSGGSPAMCNWYGYPQTICVVTQSGWGNENGKACVSLLACNNQ